MIADARSGSTVILNGMHAMEIPTDRDPETGDYHGYVEIYPQDAMFVNSELDDDIHTIHVSYNGEDGTIKVDDETYWGLKIAAESSLTCPQCGYDEIHHISFGAAEWDKCFNCTYETDPA
jgi:hypothetical protein